MKVIHAKVKDVFTSYTGISAIMLEFDGFPEDQKHATIHHNVITAAVGREVKPGETIEFRLSATS